MPKYNKPENIYLQGKVSWFRTKAPNQWNKWSVQLHPDKKSLEIIRELQSQGVKNQLKKDDDGYFTTFSRPVTKDTASGKVLVFDQVKVFDKEGVPFEGNVGNGSDATLKIEVYEHNTPGGGRAKAARWVSARIDNLVPFDPDVDLDDNSFQEMSDLRKQPEQKDSF